MKLVLGLSIFILAMEMHGIKARQKHERIVGGTTVHIERFPYMVRLIMLNKRGRFLRTRCGASIIHDYWVLTAAHCLDRFTYMYIDNKRALIRGNVTYIKEYGHHDHEIVYSYVHEKYHILESNVYDIAVIKVKQPFNGVNERPIKVAPPDHEYRAGATAYLLGWGYKNKAVMGYPSRSLRITTNELMNNTVCRRIISQYKMLGGAFKISTPYADDNNNNITFCTWEIDKGPCEEDNGGPVVQHGLLIGIITVRIDCASEEFPNVHTKASQFYDWILNNTKTCENEYQLD